MTGHPEIDAEIINWYLGRGLKLTPLDKDNPDLTKRGKVPIYRSWPSKVVDFDRLLDRAHRGHNLGFVVPDHIAVLDIDPRNDCLSTRRLQKWTINNDLTTLLLSSSGASSPAGII